MTDKREELIEEARAFVHQSHIGKITARELDRAILLLRRMVAVFEKAHTPTDDEREARARILAKLDRIPDSDAVLLDKADVCSALRCPVQGEPTATGDRARGCFGHCDTKGWYSECVSKAADQEPQGEPSDAQVQAALDEFMARTNNAIQPTPGTMRAALRAAGEVK